MNTQHQFVVNDTRGRDVMSECEPCKRIGREQRASDLGRFIARERRAGKKLQLAMQFAGT